MDFVRKSCFEFPRVEVPQGVDARDWGDWKWQFRHSLKTEQDFSSVFKLSEAERAGFAGAQSLFRVQTTPYYGALMDREDPRCPIRQMVMPSKFELVSGSQQMSDPLGENKARNRVCQRLIHRYTDRALFLVTDMCAVYCRYCTRKHFTASDQVVASSEQLKEVLTYLHQHPEIKEVIFSGGDPLSLSNVRLAQYIEAIYSVPSVELIRIGSRLPVACPMRMDSELIEILHRFRPVYLMTHFNHPDELTHEAAEGLERCVDRGIPVFNQLVLLNGINNDAALIYALNRRLLYLRVKPYYMFQADPSMGTDHLRTSIDQSLEIQKALWGRSSGLSMPTFIVDIPDGGGKAALTPQHQVGHEGDRRHFRGWDGVEASYISPPDSSLRSPKVSPQYAEEWQALAGE
jgi:lysine 2,3-aminomutase